MFGEITQVLFTVKHGEMNGISFLLILYSIAFTTLLLSYKKDSLNLLHHLTYYG